MSRRLLIGLLLGGGLLLAGVGVQRWFDARAAGATVDAFMKAVSQGDRSTALSLLTPERRRLAESNDGAAKIGPGPVEVDYEIDSLELDGNKATAVVRIEKDGQVVQPLFRLYKGETTRWKIARIDNLPDDLRQSDSEESRLRRADEQLGRVLQQAFADRPAVTVQRAPLPDFR